MNWLKKNSYWIVLLVFFIFYLLIVQGILPKQILYNEQNIIFNFIGILLLCLICFLSLKKSAFKKPIYQQILYFTSLLISFNLVLSFWVNIILIFLGNDSDAIGLSWLLILPVTVITILLLNKIFWKKLSAQQ
jgi:hypothetical protein